MHPIPPGRRRGDSTSPKDGAGEDFGAGHVRAPGFPRTEGSTDRRVLRTYARVSAVPLTREARAGVRTCACKDKTATATTTADSTTSCASRYSAVPGTALERWEDYAGCSDSALARRSETDARVKTRTAVYLFPWSIKGKGA